MKILTSKNRSVPFSDQVTGGGLPAALHEKKGDSFIFLLCARAQKKTGIVFTSRSKFGLLAAASCGGSGCSQGVLTCRALEVQGVFGVKSSLMFRGQMALRVTQRRGEISGRDGLICERFEEIQTFLDLRNLDKFIGFMGLLDAARTANDRWDVALLFKHTAF